MVLSALMRADSMSGGFSGRPPLATMRSLFFIFLSAFEVK